jgi:hypothetical protein
MNSMKVLAPGAVHLKVAIVADAKVSSPVVRSSSTW